MLTIVIPVRNERESLGALLDKYCLLAPSLPQPYRLLIVDGVSTDGTRDVARRYQTQLPIEVIALAENIGLGGALEVGLLRALEEPGIIITMDGDNSHDPATILPMLTRMEQGDELVVASRFEPGGAEVGVVGYRKLLSHAASGLLQWLFPVGDVKDYSSGYRAYRTTALERVRVRYPRLVGERGFSCMMELLLKLRAVDVRASEVPLVLRYDLKQGESKMNVGHTIVRYLVVIARNLRLARGRLRPASLSG